jgi:hypothetical protein
MWGVMAQLSRTQQAALAGVLLLALVAVLALRLHGKAPSEPTSTTPSAPAGAHSSRSSASAHNPASPTPVYHGAAPGVEGLTRDIAKAHGAVATSQQNAAELQRRSAQASGEAPHASGGTTAAQAKPAGKAATGVGTQGAARSAGAHRGQGAGSGRPVSTNRAPQQVQVERELAHGQTVMLVFWYPRSSVDVSVRSQALALAHGSRGKLAVHVARPDQVGLFGPVTEVAHVYQTPTVLIVNKHGLVSTLTGLTDEFSLKQAVREAERVNR